eukprot:6293720-Amphidinium_carterae.3
MPATLFFSQASAWNTVSLSVTTASAALGLASSPHSVEAQSILKLSGVLRQCSVYNAKMCSFPFVNAFEEDVTVNFNSFNVPGPGQCLYRLSLT